MSDKEKIGRGSGKPEGARFAAAPAGQVYQSAGIGGRGGRWGRGVRLYVLVVGVVGVATVLRWAVDPVLGAALQFITFYPAVVVAALVGGARAGVMATVLSALAVGLGFSEPRGSLAIEWLGDWVALALFMTAGGLISWMAERVDRARSREAKAIEQKRVAEAAREGQARAERILSSITDGFFALDQQWRLTYVNPQAERLLQRPAGELLGGNVRELLHDAQAFRQRCEAAIASGRAMEFEEFYEPLGAWFEVRAYPCADGLSVYFRDVTERKEFQEGLERMVAERTAKLQDMVDELEHFSYSITHDLKSPLRAMRGFAEIASRMCGDEIPQEARDALGRISISAERMDVLIADALKYGRSMRQELPVTDVDADGCLRGMLDSYPELHPSKADIQVQGRLPMVVGNEAGLTQCFSNLLGNAVKFVKPGQRPEIRIWSEEREGWARIWVEDKGIGISKEMLPRVFHMFSRGSKDYEGTGIGLALTRKMTERMGGRAGVESEEGKGSRFWIELKLGEVRPEAGRIEAAPVEPRGGTVLYVEDEESDAMFMKMAFADRGMESALQVVNDGRKAVDYLSGSGTYADRTKYPLPSVVLLDLNLPQMPGFEVLKWMRNSPDYARTPVVIFSASTREDDRAKALKLGANEFIAKPNSGLRFTEVLGRLQEKWMGAEMQRASASLNAVRKQVALAGGLS